MKKTLFLALALTAGVSFAATTSLEDALLSQWGAAELTTTTSLTGIEGLTNDFTYTFTLDPQSAALNIVGTNKNNKAITFVSVTDSDPTHIFGTGIGYSSNSSNIITQAGMYAQFNKVANDTNIIGGSFSGGIANLFGNSAAGETHREVDWENLTGIAATLSYKKGTGSYLYITMSYDGEQADETFTVDATGMRWGSSDLPTSLGVNTNVVTSVYLFSGAATAEQAFALNSAAIAATPEPATATLSLLALAGLAARRKRH